jgi:riboflavin transporter FmnP
MLRFAERLLVAIVVLGLVGGRRGSSAAPMPPASPSPRPEAHPKPQRWLGLLFVAILTGSVLVATLLPFGSLPPTSFYSSAAQIIPVLIVALAVESRSRDVWDNVPRVTKYALIGSLMLGQAVAIVASSGLVAIDPNDYSNYIVTKESDLEAGILVGPGLLASEIMGAVTAASLGVGFLGVVVVALVRRPSGP